MKSEMKKLGLNGGSTIDGIEFSHGSYLIENASKCTYSSQIEDKMEQAIKSFTERKESEIKANKNV